MKVLKKPIYRFKTKEEFEKEFGPNPDEWKTEYNWITDMNYLFGLPFPYEFEEGVLIYYILYPDLADNKWGDSDWAISKDMLVKITE